MKNKTALLTLILCAALLFSGCKTVPNEENDKPKDNDTEFVEPTEPTEPTDPTEPIESTEPVSVFPEDFVFPKTDGSTSTTNLDNAVRSAVLGGEQKTAHSKTYTSFDNLLKGNCELIFTTPLSEAQLKTMEDAGFKHEAEPVAGEGFVFVVNKDNPVDTLTVEQLKGIYSGEITNWSEVGGNDAEIIAYQRNNDSGSQNYMISFMGDTPLMKPVTDVIPASMSGILDVVANYDNGINAIGYSVYAYSDGMYENISEIKYIKVNGVEPSLKTLADGSYPLLGYNYAVFSADEPEDSNVRTLVKWIQSDEGQQVIADAGYIPYRRVYGLTLPEPTTKVLYSASATSGISKPDTAADYYYECGIIPESFTTAGLTEKVQKFIEEATAELSEIDETKIKSFVDSRDKYGSSFQYDPGLFTRKELVNGYLSVVVGIRYVYMVQECPFYYYDVRTAVFDIYTGEQLELSDLFFDGVDIAPLLNDYLAAESVIPYSGLGTTHDMLHDFNGLYEGDFSFTANSIIFRPGTCFADGVELSLDGLSEYMVTSVPRDMAGYVEGSTPICREIKISSYSKIGNAEEKNGITIWYLDKKKASLSDEVCDKVNAYIDETYEMYFTEEKLIAAAKERGFDAETVEIGPFPDFWLSITGNRFIEFYGANLAFVYYSDGGDEFIVIDGNYNPYHFSYFFNAQTGEELRIGDLFADGWQDNAKYYIADDSFSEWRDSSTWKEYTAEFNVNSSRILYINNYALYTNGKETPVIVIVEAENGDKVAVTVPREYIK